MRAAGIAGFSRRKSAPITTRQATGHDPASDLVRRNFIAERSNESWVANIIFHRHWPVSLPRGRSPRLVASSPFVDNTRGDDGQTDSIRGQADQQSVAVGSSGSDLELTYPPFITRRRKRSHVADPAAAPSKFLPCIAGSGNGRM
jgi:hypothetical protein